MAWCAQRQTATKALVQKVPREVFTNEGHQVAIDLSIGKAWTTKAKPFSDEEAKSYLQTQLLAYLGKEVGRAQKSKYFEGLKHAIDIITLSDVDLEPLPIEDFSVSVPKIREVIPTGIEALDEQIRGLGRGELGICAAPSGRGKTNLLINLAVSAALTKRSVLYITVADQGRDELIPRIDSSILEEECKPDASAQELVERHDRAIKQIPGKIWIADYTNRECSITDIDTVLSVGKTDLVVIDHADDITSPYSNDPTVTRHSLRLVYTTLKRFAVKYDIPIWTASQTHEQSWALASSGISGLAEAKTGKASGASLVLVFTGGMPEVPGVMWCTIAKARRTYKQSILRLRYDFSVARVWS